MSVCTKSFLRSDHHEFIRVSLFWLNGMIQGVGSTPSLWQIEGGGEGGKKKKTDDRLKLRLGNDIARALIERLHCSNVAVASCVIL